MKIQISICKQQRRKPRKEGKWAINLRKGKKGAEEIKPKMITPDPVLMEKESGRVFRFEIGRFEEVKKEGEGEEQGSV